MGEPRPPVELLTIAGRLRATLEAASELDDFLTPTRAGQLEAEQAFVNGDPTLRLAM